MTDIIRLTEEDVQKAAEERIHRRLSTVEVVRVGVSLRDEYGSALRVAAETAIDNVAWKTRMDI